MTPLDDPRLLPHATPEAMELVRSNVPIELQDLDAWVCGSREPKSDKAGNVKSSKVPISPLTGRNAMSNAPSSWAPLAAAIEHALKDNRCFGVGINLVGSQFTGLDLDHVIDNVSGELRAEAAELLAKLPHTYTEISPSGDGLRLFYCGMKPAGMRGCVIKNAFGPGTQLEVYDGKGGGRYLTVTGHVWWDGDPVPLAEVSESDLAPLLVV